MIFKIFPHPDLDKIVDYYWIDKIENTSVKILPDGTTSIIINIGGTISIVDLNGDFREFPDNLIIGPHKKYFILKMNKGTHFIGIKFKQGGAYHFFKIPMMQFSNKIISLSEIMRRESEQLNDALIKAEKAEDIKKILDRYLLMKIDLLNSTFDIVDFTLNKLKVNEPPELIKNLCIAAKISNKHMILLFKKKVGLSPKLIQRINKFVKVIEILHEQEQVDWSEIAFLCHYYDQAHLINEFKCFSGLTPKEYFENENTNGLRVKFE